ncbi:MAG: cytochrome c [Sphingomicrobium sp.]
MRRIIIAIAALGLLTAAAAPRVSGAAAKTIMHERHEGMEKIGKATKLLAREIKSGTPDMAALRTNAATMNALARKSSLWFPQGTGPEAGKTRALADVWNKPEDFAARMKTFQLASARLNAAARAGDTAAATAAFGDLGKSCKACHDLYRSEDKH